MKRFLLVLLACACASSLPLPDAPGASDSYRGILARKTKGPEVVDARDRLDEAEWQRAHAANTLFALRHYQDEFPDGAHAAEARAATDQLRWAQADAAGSEEALAAYVADEPHGAHAADAWARLAALRLRRAVASGDAAALRAWLAANPDAAGRDEADAALDEADWRAARDGDGLRAYLKLHEAGAHRREARQRLEALAREEAILLEDEASLPPADAARVAYARAAALLDEGRLHQLAAKGNDDARRALDGLRRDPAAGVLESQARALFLPAATLDELPQAAPERAARLREWAAALDGRRLHRVLAELASQRAQVGCAALETARQLLHGLPQAEARVRAGRELEALEPLAQDAPQLVGVALLREALGDAAGALDAARTAAGRDAHSIPATLLAVRLETDAGLREVNAAALRAAANALASAHATGAAAGDAGALGELCVARAALVEAGPRAHADAEAVAHRIEEGGAGRDVCAAPDLARTASLARAAAAQALAATRSPLARAALSRAASRDPDPRVRAAAAR